MHFPYAKIIKQAWVFIRTNKFLWALGLFLLWANLINYSSILYQSQSEESYQQSVDQSNAWMATHASALNWIGTAIMVFIVVMLYLYLRARAATAIAVRDMMEHKPTGFSEAMRQAAPFPSKLLQIWIVTTLAVLVSAILLFLPVIYLLSQNFTDRALILGLFAFAILVPITIVAGFVNVMSGMFTVLFSTGIRDSIKGAFDLITKQWVVLASMTIILISITFAGFFASIAVASVATAPFVFFTKMPYYIGAYDLSGAITATGIALGTAIFFWLMGLFASFQNVCWTLVFMELVKPKKTEAEEETAVVPEIIS